MAREVNLAFDADSAARLVKKAADDPKSVLTVTAGVGAVYVAYRILRAVVPLLWRLRWALVAAGVAAGAIGLSNRK